METQTVSLTNAEVIALRERPELPRELSRFNPFWIRLPKKPLGPPYIGEGKFQTDRIPRAIIDDIYRDALTGQSLKQIMTKLVEEFHLFVHAETVCNHIPKDLNTKLFTYTKWDTPYIKEFEKNNGLVRHTVDKVFKDKAKELYKPFIIWAIENGYGYWQITSLPVAGNTIRMWANSWGYATGERIHTRTISREGITKRSTAQDDTIVGHLPGERTYSEDEVTVDREHGSLRFPKKKFTGRGQIALAFEERRKEPFVDRDLACYSAEALSGALQAKGFRVYLEYDPPVVEVKETVHAETKSDL